MNQPADRDKMASVRLPGDLVSALRARADATGESVSELLRQGALMLLGVCPTCGREVAADT